MIAPHHAQLGHFVVSPATKRPNLAERDVSGDVCVGRESGRQRAEGLDRRQQFHNGQGTHARYDRDVRDTAAPAGRVLLVEGDPSVRRVIAQRLEHEGFDVRECEAAAELDQLLPDVRPDLVLLELPRVDTLLPLERLRANSEVPAIALLRADLDADYVDALEAGADHCVTKPFSPRELMAKVRGALRRAGRTVYRDRLEFDGLVVDRRTRQVERAGETVAMPAREFDLLAYLATSPGRVFTRGQLLEQVWESSEAWLGAATVTEHVRRLRQRIEKNPKHPRWIVTVWSVGYRFES
jgi:DNA-binding response OmpR family regulator